MNFKEWNKEWQEEIKNLLLQTLREKNDDPWNLHYENKTSVDFDEFIARLYDDRYFEEAFINAFEKKFPEKVNELRFLNQINKLFNALIVEIKVSSDLLENKKWFEIRRLVKLLVENGF